MLTRGLLTALLLAPACSPDDRPSCTRSSDCRDPAADFCDVRGIHDASGYTAGACIRFPDAPTACDERHPCRDPERPYCDIAGAGPGSQGVPNSCIPSPDAERPDDPLSFTVVVLPDTQMYALEHPALFDAQTSWIAAQRDARNIRMVAHVGDVVEHGDQVPQWMVARGALQRLDGAVPYAIAIGNHDYWIRERARETIINDHLPPQTFTAMPGFGGFFSDGVVGNSYHLFELGDQPWLLLALEFGPRKAVLDWASEVLSQHSDRLAIIATHAYLYDDSSRYDWEERGDDQKWNPHIYQRIYGGIDTEEHVNDGEFMWETLVSRHDNLRLVVSGHVLDRGLGFLTSTGDGGNPVHQILANYQHQANGGDGFLRLLEVHPGARAIHVQTYSPALDTHKDDHENDFWIGY